MNLENIPQLNKGKPSDVNMLLVELENTWISTDYAQKSPWRLTRLRKLLK